MPQSTSSRPIGYTSEGRIPTMPPGTVGTVATCKVPACGWMVWKESRREAESTARDHKCRNQKGAKANA